MPACQIGCCPVDSCECSIALNNCECLFTIELDGSLVLENSHLTAEHHYEKLRLTTLHTICSCRTKDELTDYLKPVVPYLDDDNTDAADIDCQTDEDGDIAEEGINKDKPVNGKNNFGNEMRDDLCAVSHSKKLSRTNSLPLRQSSNPNSPSKVTTTPNFDLKTSLSFEIPHVSFLKTKRSQSIAEARLGDLLNERRPSCFLLSTQELRSDAVPDPHQGHEHNRIHEYHHEMFHNRHTIDHYSDNHHHEVDNHHHEVDHHDHHHHHEVDNHDHHHHHEGDHHDHHHHHEGDHHDHHHHHEGDHHDHHHHHEGDHHDHHHHHEGDHHDHHHYEGDHHDHHHHEKDDHHCHQDGTSQDTSCCHNSKCDEQLYSSDEEFNSIVKSDYSKLDIDDMTLRTTKLRVQNLCCPKEATIVRDELQLIEGIEKVRINVLGRVVHVTHYVEVVSATSLMTALNKRHLGASIVDTGSEADAEKGLPRSMKIRLANLTVQFILFTTALVGHFTSGSWYIWIAIAEICFGVLPILKKGYRACRNKDIDLNILITITVIGTLVIQEWVEGAAVVFVFTLAGFLQRFCFYRVQKTISSLMLSKPSMVVMACTGECVPVEQVLIGSIIAVRQGELIPLDGVVVKGEAYVDESSISGEATPVEKSLASSAYSGTVIQHGYLEIETTSNFSCSTMSKISAMVEDAQLNVSPTEITVNKFAKIYTPLVIVVAILVFLIPFFLGLAGVDDFVGKERVWGIRALIVLVTACPCALLLATPTVVICGITGAAHLGALVKGGTYLEALGHLNVLAFDKTGTLTEGKFQVVDLVSVDEHDESVVLRWAAAIESKSSHPLAAAIVNEFTGECVSEFVKDSDVLPNVDEFYTMEGQGISGKVEGHNIQVGNRSLLEKLGLSLSSTLETKYFSFCADAKTVVFVCVDGELALMISLADIIRLESRDAIKWLQDLDVHLCMLTGDSKQTANAVQSQLKLDSCLSDLKPDDKLNWVVNTREQDVRKRRFFCRKKKSQVVGMVGDGVNDGPALAASHVGIAMAAGGSALAVEAAGVALMNNSILKVPEMICLSRFCRRIIQENIILSVLLKAVFVVVALTGYVRVWMAVLADLVGLVVVIINGLRPLKWKPLRKSDRKEPPRASFKRKKPLLLFESTV